MDSELNLSRSPKILQEFNIPLSLSDEGYAKILGEILHFCIEDLIEHTFFLQDKLSQDTVNRINHLVDKVLSSFPDPFPERDKVSSEAKRLLESFLKNEETLKKLRQILSSTKKILIEPQAYFHRKGKILRPDIVLISSNRIYLIEIKLKPSDLSEEQINDYLSLLRDLYPDFPLSAYLLTLDPPGIKELSKEEERYAKKLSFSTQLPLFR